MENKTNIKSIQHKLQTINIPIVKEMRGRDYVVYGEDNLFPVTVIDLYNKSAIHRTALDSIIAGIIGNGINVIGDNITNSKGETIDELFEKISFDFALFNGFSLNIIWNKEGNKIVEMYHLPFNNVRAGVIDEEENVNEYFYSTDWAQFRKYTPKSYKAFSATDNRGENGSQIFYFSIYNPSNIYYPLPSYFSAVNDIDLDARIGRFHNANISNGLAPSMFIKFRNGIPSPEERKVVYNEIDEVFAGESNAGRFFLSFSDADNAMEVQTLENVNDDYYLALDERITSRILTAHKITSPLLLGIKDANGFSSNADEIEVAYAHFQGTVIAPKRKKILNNLGYLLKFAGYTVQLDVIPNQLTTKKTTE